jgi:hypothetical protein
MCRRANRPTVFARKTPAVEQNARLRVEITQLRQRLTEPGRYHDPDGAKRAIEHLLDEAASFADADDAWCRVHEAARREIAFLDPRHREARTTELRCEIDKKLVGWRLHAAKKHLQRNDDAAGPEFAEAALGLLYDKASNDYRKIASAGHRCSCCRSCYSARCWRSSPS